MGNSVYVPTSLKVVAYLFMLSGVVALIDIIVAAGEGRLQLNFGVLGLFIGGGLLRLNPTWRTVALVFCVLGMAAAFVAGFVLLVTTADNLDFKVFGRKVGEFPTAATAVFIVAVFLISLWQYWVLTRPHVRALFARRLAEG